MISKKLIAISLVAAGVLSGCGSSSSNKINPTSGVVVDDYIRDAKVCADTNENGIYEIATDKPCVMTDEQGAFKFADEITYPLIMTGGVDIGTGEVFTGTFTAPKGSKVVNPLTTVLESIVKTGKTLAEAETELKQSLGLPDVDLTTYDPLKEVQFNSDPAAKERARAVLAQQTRIQVILEVTASVVKSASASVNGTDASSVAADKLAALLLVDTTTGEVDISSEASIKEIINETAMQVVPVADRAKVDAVKVTIATQVATIVKEVVKEIQEADVSSEEAAVGNAIGSSNAALLLATSQLNTAINTAVTTGNTSTVTTVATNVTVELNTARETVQNTRPVVEENHVPQVDESTN